MRERMYWRRFIRLPRRNVDGDRARLACLDQAAKWVDDFEAHEALPAKAGEVARRLAEELRSMLGGGAPTEPKRRSDGRRGEDVPNWARRLIDLGKPRRGGLRVVRTTFCDCLRAECRLFFRWRRSAGADAAHAEARGISRCSARRAVAFLGPRSVFLQSAPARYFRSDRC